MNEKKWSLRTIVLYGINCVIGSGIFLLPGSAYKMLGPGSILAYVFVLLLVMSIALCFAECGSMFDKSGGPYLYAEKAFGRFIGYEVGVMKWIVSIIAWATMAVGFVTALSVICPSLTDPVIRKYVAMGVILILSMVNLLGVNIMAFLNNISTIAKLIPMILFVVVGIFFLEPSNFVPLFPENADVTSASAAIILVFYAFTGFENVGVAAGDMENPTQNVPKAVILSMTIVSIIYFFVQLNCIGTMGSELGSSITPVADAMGTFLGAKGALLVTIGTLVSIGGLNIAGSFNTPRCAQALADGELLPRQMGKCNQKNVPYISVIITGILAILLTLTGSFTELAAISVISRFSQYIPTCMAVIILRKRNPAYRAPYRVPFGVFFPLVAVVASVWLLVHADSSKLIAGLGAMLLIAPLYFFVKKGKGKPQD